MNFPRRYPRNMDSASSPKSNRTKPALKLIPVSSPSAISELKAKRIITTTSEIIVTPSNVWVKGPLARNSLTMAIADEGERATKIAPAKIEMAIRLVTDIF